MCNQILTLHEIQNVCMANKKYILAMLTPQILPGYLLTSMHHSVIIFCFLCFQQKAKPCELTNTLPLVTQDKHHFLFQTQTLLLLMLSFNLSTIVP